MSAKWKKILGIVVTVVTIIILVLVVLSGIQGYFPVATTPIGSSMEPTLHRSDLVLTIPYQVASRFYQVTEGDIIVFKAPAIPSVWCHRVVGIEDGKYVTQGDANRRADSFLTAESDILGIVPSIGGQPLLLPYWGSVLTYFNYNSAVRFGLLAACIVALVVIQVKERKKRRLKRPSRFRVLKVSAILLGVGIAIFALMFLPSLSKSGYTAIGYQVAEGPGISSGGKAPIEFGLMEIGTSQSKEFSFENEGLIPAVVVFHLLDDEFNEVSISPSTLVLGSNSQEKMGITVDATEVNSPQSVKVSMTMVPYLMPADLVTDLASKNPWLPALVIAAVPAVVLPAVLYALLPRIRRRRAVNNKRKKPGFPIPKRALIFIAPLVLIAVIMGGQYFAYAQITTPAGLNVTVTEHQSASVGWEAFTIDRCVGGASEEESLFTITNNLSHSVDVVVGAPTVTCTPDIDIWEGWHTNPTELGAGETKWWKGYLDESSPVTCNLVFDIHAYRLDGSFHSYFDVTVLVTINPPPP